jgi:predicted thioredoxin/glutaredoxin
MKKEVIIYSRQDCYLCHEVYAELISLYEDFIDINMIDVDNDITLKKKYGLIIPIISIDGEDFCANPVKHDHIRKILDL